jgi:23S rRNA pseudouridine1911/1915/1917 synthase
MRNPEVSTAADYSLWDDADPEQAGAESAPAASEVLELTVDRKGARRLDKWLAEQLPQFSRARLQDWIAQGVVQVDGVTGTVRQPVYADQMVRVTVLPLAEESAFVAEEMPLSIVFEDQSLLIIDKPAGLVVHPAAGNWSGTLLNGLLHYDPQLAAVPRAGIVHRLDKDTTGLMVVARTATAQTDLVRQLQARRVTREYLAVSIGHPPPSGICDGAIGRDPRDRLKMAVLNHGAVGARDALTHFRVLGRGNYKTQEAALVALRLETGRTHQIRVHLAHAGFPIAGDQVYAPSGARGALPRQALHAARLGLNHPVSGSRLSWSSAVPPDLHGLLVDTHLLEALDGF